MAHLLPGYDLRPARAQDIWVIRKLVLAAKLDPTQLRWSQFWVIEFENQIIACGQLRCFEAAQELGSLVVRSAWRHQGLGTYLAQYLIQQATQPLYLECVGSRLVQFYTRLGFIPIGWQQLPHALKWKFGLTKLMSTLFPFIPVTLMRHPGKAAEVC